MDSYAFVFGPLLNTPRRMFLRGDGDGFACAMEDGERVIGTRIGLRANRLAPRFEHLVVYGR